MATSKELGIGYLGWSWSGNTGSDFAKDLDITIDFDLDNLSTWGNLLINGENGLKATGNDATVFDTDSIDPGGEATLFVDCQLVSTSTWPGGFQANIVVTNSNSLAMKNWWTNLVLNSAVSITNYWNSEFKVIEESPLQIQVTNAAWNG